MNSLSPHANLVAAWLGMFCGFGSGLGLGLFFHRENWLGGYASLKRRMYRLGHISFFGLGAVNLMFYFSCPHLNAAAGVLAAASWAFIVGAVTMPLCCLLMAHFPRTRLVFGLPVLSLLTGAVLTLFSLIAP